MYFDKIHKQITSKYKKKKDQKIAEKCLQLGEEWAKIVSGDFSDFSKFATPTSSSKRGHKKKLRKECGEYIRAHLDPQEVKSFFPAWVLPFVIQVILSTVISWIVRRMIDDIVED
jgi:hypothetical protein